MSDPDHAVPAKSHRPGNTAIKQQRLPSWQLVLTPKHTIPVYFVIALLFIPVGVGLYYAQSRVHEVIINYTNCDTLAGTTLAKPPSNAGEHTDAIQQWSYDPATKLCTIQFRVGEDIATPVYMQYRLTNFFQNHRKYTKNFDRRQLRGDALSLEGLHEGACTLSDASGTAIGTSGVAAPGAVFYPCGIIANSFFLDEIADNLTCIRTDEPLPENAPCAGNPYPMTQQGISWASDRSGKWSYQRTRYLDPATLGRVFPGATNLTQVVVPPPDWIQFHPRYANGYTNETVPDLSDWERFQAWMKPAGHSTFRKPWGKNTELNLQRGTWQVQVAMYYDVKRLEATKSLVLTNMGPVGGRNRFLGSSYAIFGCISLLVGLIFLLWLWVKPRALGDHSFLAWNRLKPAANATPGHVHASAGFHPNESDPTADPYPSRKSGGGGGGGEYLLADPRSSGSLGAGPSRKVTPFTVLGGPSSDRTKH